MDDHSSGPILSQDKLESSPTIVQWSVFDVWLGFGMYVVLTGLTVLAAVNFPVLSTSAILMVGIELFLLLPIGVIFLWRKISWKELGFRKFEWSAIGLGCGLLVVVYAVIIIHNIVMVSLGVVTQADVVFGIFDHLDSPVLFFFVSVVMAPIVEEMFFRGFMFKGFRQKYGVKAALIVSSLMFALSHFQLAAFLPTFLLGATLAYVYHRTDSLFPGMILHFLINAWGIGAMFAIYKFGAM
jgi:membrane protease YdiL (CAAX protease family)